MPVSEVIGEALRHHLAVACHEPARISQIRSPRHLLGSGRRDVVVVPTVGAMSVRWLTAFIDRPEATFAVATGFWQRATGTTRSAPRGDHDQFATLLPGEGDAHLRVQRVDGGAGGTRLDLHTDDRGPLMHRAVGLGATVVDTSLVPVLRWPGGYTWCIVSWHGEATPARPFVGPTGAPSRLDQLYATASRSGRTAERQQRAGVDRPRVRP